MGKIAKKFLRRAAIVKKDTLPSLIAMPEVNTFYVGGGEVAAGWGGGGGCRRVGGGAD